MAQQKQLEEGGKVIEIHEVPIKDWQQCVFASLIDKAMTASARENEPILHY